MITAIRWLWPPGAPSLREVPSAIARAILLGIVAALPLGLFFTWFNQGSLVPLWSSPFQWLLRAASISVTYALSFYVMCGLPVSYVARHVLGGPHRHARAIMAFTGLAGGTLGCVTALIALATFRGSLSPQLSRLAVLDGILAMVLAMVLSGWHKLRIEKDLADARARSHVLQAQISPHFFFNTLNTISALIPVDPPAAQRTLGRLADMNRYAFASAESEVVPLARELEFAEMYLEIEKIRFGDRLRVALPRASNVEGISLPAFTLQPLIENAIRHGVSRCMDGGVVSVFVHRDDGRFALTVENDVADVPNRDGFFRAGHALANIRERLRLVYGDKGGIGVTFPRTDSVAVMLEAPIQP